MTMQTPATARIGARDGTWELMPASRAPQLGAMLRVGARAIPTQDIKGFIGSAEHEADKKPALATLAVFGSVALFFLLGVLDIGWRPRFLVAFGLFGIIAISALNDMFWMTQAGLYRVEILTQSGETVRYATTDQAQHDALLDVLSETVTRAKAANDDVPEPATLHTFPSRRAPQTA